MSDVKFNCPLKNKPRAGGGGVKKKRERKSEREREKEGERRREGEEAAIKQFSGPTKPRRGLDYCK